MTRTEEEAFVQYLQNARTTPDPSKAPESKASVSAQERFEDASGHVVYGASHH